MIDSIVNKLTDLLEASGADPSKQAIYAYGLECLISTAIIISLLLIFGIIFQSFWTMVIFILFWIPLRMLVGGFHAKTHLTCTVLSVGIGTFAVIVTPYVSTILWFYSVTALILSYCAIFFLSPVLHKNHPLSEERVKKNRIKARIYGFIELAVIILLLALQSPAFAPAMLAYIITVICAIVAKIQEVAARRS